MNSVKFASTKLGGLGKKGIITPDSDGYYELVIGGLNAYNSANEYYSLEGAKSLFEDSSIFMRRIKSGCLKGELGHPKQQPGMNINDFINRLYNIEETNVVCHFKEIRLDLDFGKKNPKYNNPELVAVIAKVKPAGPRSSSLESALSNPHEDVCFSVRGFTKDYYKGGKTIRVLEQIITYDNVTEPGINISRKYESPSLENLDSMVITERMIKQMIDSSVMETALESEKELVRETLDLFKDRKARKVATLPIIHNW